MDMRQLSYFVAVYEQGSKNTGDDFAIFSSLSSQVT